jgi:DNA-binding transcriptional LysR family regulator
MAIRIRQLQALEAVMSARTMTEAAAVLGISQPALSRLIADLETDVGYRLLVRQRGRLALTAAGEQFYPEAEKVLTSLRDLTGLARDMKEDQRGSLRVIAMPGFGVTMVPQAVAAFSAVHPKVRISVHVRRRRELEAAIAAEPFDVALATLPIHAPGVTAMPLATLPAVCIVPSGHALARRVSLAPQDLAGIPFISLNREAPFRGRVDELFERFGVERDLRFEAETPEMICGMVANGVGASILHPFLHHIAPGAFAVKPFAPAVQMEYALLRSAARVGSVHVEEFCRIVMAQARRLDAGLTPASGAER